MRLYPFAFLAVLSVSFPPLFAVTIAIGIAFICHRWATRRHLLADRQAALEIKQRQDRIRAWRSIS